MTAKKWLSEHEWTESDFSDSDDLESMATCMELFANVRILEVLKTHGIKNPYCFCDKPISVLNNKSKCANEICERQINYER